MEQIGKLRTKQIALIALIFFFSCSSEEKKTTKKRSTAKDEKKAIKRPSFNADSAYHFIEAKVAFGPRVPNSEAHMKAALYLEKKTQELRIRSKSSKSTSNCI